MKNLSDIKALMMARGICVIIPTYNNQSTIGDVIGGVANYCNDIIVVNDGSTDSTSSILAERKDILIVEYEHNKGKGYALKMGFLKALEKGFAYAITLDADGQHYSKDIPSFLNANMDNPGELIIGNRNLDGVERSNGSDFANKFSNFWFYVQTGCHLKDTQTGYRLYPLKKLHCLALLTSKYEAELELLVFPSWHGVKIKSIPIDVYYPPKDERVSHYRPCKDFIRIFILNLVLCPLAIVYGLPLRIWRTLMTFFRTIYAMFMFGFGAVILIAPFVWVYVKINKNSHKTTEYLHNLIYKVSRFVMVTHGIPGTKFFYSIAKGVNFDKPYVIICNHQSHFDTMCQLIFSPKIVFLTNDWVWNNFFYGLLIRNAEYLPVINGLEPLLPKLRDLVSRGYSIAVFPEGTRSRSGKIGRFHHGAFYIAEQLNLDILPMLLYGTGRILPPKTYHLRKGIIRISVEMPIERKELSTMGDIVKQASCTRKMYIQKYTELKNNIEQNV